MVKGCSAATWNKWVFFSISNATSSALSVILTSPSAFWNMYTCFLLCLSTLVCQLACDGPNVELNATPVNASLVLSLFLHAFLSATWFHLCRGFLVKEFHQGAASRLLPQKLIRVIVGVCVCIIKHKISKMFLISKKSHASYVVDLKFCWRSCWSWRLWWVCQPGTLLFVFCSFYHTEYIPSS